MPSAVGSLVGSTQQVFQVGTDEPSYLLNEDGSRLLLEDGTGALLLEESI